jgi:hypothetical protein
MVAGGIALTACGAAGAIAVNVGLIGVSTAGSKSPIGRLDARNVAKLGPASTKPVVVIRTLPTHAPKVSVIYEDVTTPAAPATPVTEPGAASGARAEEPAPTARPTAPAPAPVAVPAPTSPPATVVHVTAVPTTTVAHHEDDGGHEGPEPTEPPEPPETHDD